MKKEPVEQTLVPQWQEWLLDAECDFEKIRPFRRLARRLLSAERLRNHWPLIGEVWGERGKIPTQDHAASKNARAAYRNFARSVGINWCGNGRRVHSWQIFERLPRNIAFTRSEQDAAYEEIANLARRLERAMRNPAVSPALGNEAMFPGGSPFPRQQTFPFVRHRGPGDSVLKRLYTAAESKPIILATGLASRPNSKGARETYFARRMAQTLCYETQRAAMRAKIQEFIADLLVELSDWENVVGDWDSEWVRQTLRVTPKRPAVRSKKISP